ncbi:MAG: MoaD/ThiS family protein [Planctomycetota bacterium]
MPVFEAKLYTTLSSNVLKGEVKLEADSLVSFLDKIAEKYGNTFKEEVYNKGVVKNYHIILLNGKVVDRENLSNVDLQETNSVHIFPAVSGG